MQRYHVTNCTSAVNSNSIGVGSSRDTSGARADSLAPNFPVNSRRSSLLTAYKLKCDKEPLNSRLGPPDFHPQTTNCLEETLTKEYLVAGYKETVEGLEEAREITLSQVQCFSKPVIVRCREAIRKCLRAINESRAQKRKAGQVYGVPLSGVLLTRPGVFPEQRPYNDEIKKKWIEGLSQPHKRLRTLADHVPHGYRRKSLFEVLIKNNVPLLRATWYIKVNYLNQVRPNQPSLPPGTPDKLQFSRKELWTKDFVDYLQNLLDEFISKGNSHPLNRDRSPQISYGGSMLQRTESVSQDIEEPSLHFKWWYVVRLLHWHHAEGLLLPSLVIDWVLFQLQEKDALEILQLLLPIIYGFLEEIVLSQTYVRMLTNVAVRFIREPSPGSDLVDNSRRAYTTAALIEMLRYLLLAVPETFVAIDCFPLPPAVVLYSTNDGNFTSKPSEKPRQRDNLTEVASGQKTKGLDSQYQSLSLNQVILFVEAQANSLSRAACTSYPARSLVKVVQSLDKCLVNGDVSIVYDCLFDNFCNGIVDHCWVEEISPLLRSSMSCIGDVSLPFLSSVFLLFEWATCDFRDFRTSAPEDLKLTGGKDFSQVHIVSRLLKQKLRELRSSHSQKSGSNVANNILKGNGRLNVGRMGAGKGVEFTSNSRTLAGAKVHTSDLFESPGPLHDILVCWIDQHEVFKQKSLRRVQLLVVELMRAGLFYPQVYVRQLLSSGVMDMSGNATGLERGKRHYQILKQLPGSFVRDILQESKIAEGSDLSEIVSFYSNERRLLMNDVTFRQFRGSSKLKDFQQDEKLQSVSGKDGASLDKSHPVNPMWSTSDFTLKRTKNGAGYMELKSSISALLRFPNNSSSVYSGFGNKTDVSESTLGCEDCRKTKRQKISDDKSVCIQGSSPLSDDEETWWIRKGPKLFDSPKLDHPLKVNKQVLKGRQKNVRKTQSLAQLAATRMDSNQVASTSHICDNKVNCPHHRSGMDADPLKLSEGSRFVHEDIASIGHALKRLRLAEKKSIVVWLTSFVQQLVEESVRSSSKINQLARAAYVSVDDRNSSFWKLGEGELSAMLYLIDSCGDPLSSAKFLLWLLPKVSSNFTSTSHQGRNLMLPRTGENQACEVGEAFVISAIRRYESIVAAADLFPEVLSAAMQRATALLASSGRVSGASLIYARHLLRKFCSVPSVAEWEKIFKTTCDKRLIPEIDGTRSKDVESGYPLGVPVGVEDIDDFLRQKMNVNRFSRIGVNMKDIVQRNIDDASQYYFGKERKTMGTAQPKIPGLEKYDDGTRVAQQIVSALMECILQTGGAAQEGDPSLVTSAVAAIVNNIGPTMAKLPDLIVGGDITPTSSSIKPLTIARRLVQIHVNCLCLLKEALGERQSRVFEIALANEASSALAVVFASGKSSRSQFQLPHESHDSNANVSLETLNHATKSLTSKGTRSVASISALVIGAMVHGVSTLERMLIVFRLKDGLDITQYMRSTKSHANGNARLVGSGKVDTPVDVYVHWFRLLVGNCRTLCDGLVVELIGEQHVAALSRMQRLLPINLVFPPAYSIFAFVLWRQLVFNSSNLTALEDAQQLCYSMRLGLDDAIKHLPFRDACLRDSQAFYDLVAADNSDADFAALIDSNGVDRHIKYLAFVPLRGRLFLNAIIDCKMPHSFLALDDGSRLLGHSFKHPQPENGAKLLETIVDVLDALQPSKFHWQWVELRLLLNEQAVVEKLETHDINFADAIRSASSVSENESNIIEIVLTRLLVRPDATSLFSELIHLLGRSLEDSMLKQVKWFLGGADVLYGRKSIRQRLINIAESKGISISSRFWKPWGWCNSTHDLGKTRPDAKKSDVTLEEGEVAEEMTEVRRSLKSSTLSFEQPDNHHQVTEKALVDLVLPCIDQSSEDSRITFASELIKQLTNIEQQLSSFSRGANKPPGTTIRKAIKGGSPGLSKQRSSASLEPAIPSPLVLRASVSLRLQLLLRLFPVVCTDGEHSGRNLRNLLAPVVLRLLGSRIIQDDAERLPSIRSIKDARLINGDSSCDSLYDRLLFLFHALLSSSSPSWLKPRLPSKSVINGSSKGLSGCDPDVLESLQNDLDRMVLPGSVRWQIQAAMPALVPSSRFGVCSSNVPASSLAPPQLSMPNSAWFSGNQSQRSSVPSSRAATSKPADMEIDPWTLLEDGTSLVPSSGSSSGMGAGDHGNLRACSWLQGAVRVRRTDLTYIGAVDDDS